MNAVLGHIIVIAILLVIVYFCGRNAFRSFKAELSGTGNCAGCGGSCSGCGSSCNMNGISRAEMRRAKKAIKNARKAMKNNKINKGEF